MAALSVPGIKPPTVYSMQTIMDTGSGIVVISTSKCRTLKRRFNMLLQSVRVSDSRLLRGAEVTHPVGVALHTRFGPVMLDPFALAKL